jgi:3-deoxy-D-manno-octulosonate 8-phosphate phosphatase (KDO 8-P phosphatase)
MKPNYKTLLNHITTFIFDVDGVLTDGGVLLLPGQQPVRRFHSKDGFALQHAIKAGYRVAVITGGRSEAVKERMQQLGVTDIYLGASNKIEQLEELMMMYDLTPEQMLYMGDDLPDYEAMTAVGVATTPSDGAPEIKAIADYVSPKAGGQGCVRDVIEQTLKVQGKWGEPGSHVW